MSKILRFILIVIFSLYNIQFLYSQELSSFKDKNQYKFSGSINLQSALYFSSDSVKLRDPFFWQLSGNFNISTPIFTIPISLTLSQQQKFDFDNFLQSQKNAVTQPFNQFGMSPKYKSLTTHIGYRSLKFSEFSLSGNQFMGIGTDFSPKNGIFKCKIVYGRFAKAIDTILPGDFSKTFERWGYGINTIIGNDKNNFGLILFKAKDISNSISGFDTLVTSQPADNLVFGITTKHKINKKINFDAEIDWSAYTYDTRREDSKLEGYTYLNNLGFLFYANTTSYLSKAMNYNLNFKEEKFNVKLAYRRIDPEYRTMGSVYLNNDFEDISGTLKYKFLKGRLNLGLTGGIQRNNLNKTKVSETLRLINSISSNYSPVDNKWNLNFGFSNFNSQSQMSVVNFGDTMRFAQITKSLNLQYSLNSKLKGNNLSSFFSFNFQDANVGSNIGSINQQETKTNFYNASIGSSLILSKVNTNINLLINAVNNISNELSSSGIGPTLSISKGFKTKKNQIRTNLSFSYLKSYVEWVSSGQIINSVCSLNYQISKKQTLSLNTSLSQRKISNNENLFESITTLNYNLRF
tara:strand:+ start:2 stop:1732 length:1731 start_codon:yes stop_codon:yes gene_type:complete